MGCGRGARTVFMSWHAATFNNRCGMLKASCAVQIAALARDGEHATRKCRSLKIEVRQGKQKLGNHISPPSSSPTPWVFYACFYNHARRLRLEKLSHLRQGFLKFPTGVLKRFWIRVAVLLLNLKPHHGGFSFRSETAVTQLFR